MAVENLKTLTFPVGAALAQNVFVKLDSSGNAVVAGDGEDAMGVTLEGVSSTEFTNGKRTCSVAMISGGGRVMVRAKASTAIAIGDRIASEANGEAGPAVSTNNILGWAESVAGNDADQELVQVLLDKAARLVP